MSRRFQIEITPGAGGLPVRGDPASFLAAPAGPAREVTAISATALRGALRETLERLLRGAGEPACSGGDGSEPGSGTAPPAGACALDAGSPCKACRLFGGRQARLLAGAQRLWALILHDATAKTDQLGLRRGGGIALRRAQRSLAPGRRYEHWLLEAPGPLFAAGSLLDAELAPLLETAARETKHVGAGRSRGLGRVELQLHWLETESDAPPAPALPEGDAVGVRVRLESPAGFGTGQPGAGWRETRREVPGSALRGAIGGALAEQLAAGDPGFDALLDEHSGARFGFLYPVRGHAPGAPLGAAGPWPVTARVCAAAGPEHGVVDTLLDRIRASCAQTPEETERAWSARASSCLLCGAPLEAPPGSRGSLQAPRTRLLTRTRLERTRGDAAETQIDECLDPDDDVVFEGVIAGIPSAARELLARALAAPLALGRGTAIGRGRARVELVAPLPLEPLAVRAARFEQALAARLAALGLDAAIAAQIVPISTLSPLLPLAADGDGRGDLAAALGLEPEWLLCARRFAPEGGFDQRTGEAWATSAVAGGSVFSARLRGGWRAQSAALEALERGGAGGRRHQGYGQLLCFDPLIGESGLRAPRPQARTGESGR